MTDLAEELRLSNPWWRGAYHADYMPREIYPALQKLLSKPQALALTGLRRTGKTTLLRKVASDEIGAGLDARRVLYFSFDDSPGVGIRELVRAYEDLQGEDLGQGRHVILLDEVQKVPRWPDEVKVLYDRHYGKVKFLVSGSESLFLRRGLRESLAGRLFTLPVRPLTFSEYLDFLGVPWAASSLERPQALRAWDRYLKSNGFPELVHGDDPEFRRIYVRESVVEKIIYRDLPSVVGLRHAGVLEALWKVLWSEPGQILEHEKLGKELGASRQTISAFLRYLEEAFLIRKLYNHSGSVRKVERKLKKYYPVVLAPSLLERTDGPSRGRVLESAVVHQLGGEEFWRDPSQHEVDLVLPGSPPLPIEVKYSRPDTEGLRAFFRKFPSKRGLILTHDQDGELQVDGRLVDVLPAWKALLGRAGDLRPLPGDRS